MVRQNPSKRIQKMAHMTLGLQNTTIIANNILLRSVKFDTDQLPPILNALETENAGQKLVLEVAVRELWNYNSIIHLLNIQ